ncbi:hypothetical protein lerEdw1_001829 [Lerista edwardsae]|nr:hypothetical protein lerEdw1_001829 [Lerista edwardsae]
MQALSFRAAMGQAMQSGATRIFQSLERQPASHADSPPAKKKKPFKEIREAFRVLDRDGNGFISKQELGMAMRSLGYMPSEVELAIIMQRLDMDGDGQVDFDEFMTILGPKLVSSEGRDGFLGNTIDSIFWQVPLCGGISFVKLSIQTHPLDIDFFNF